MLRGFSFIVREVTTPKLPPPPRIAQYRSSFSFSSARTRLPSARTTSAPRMLSIERPYLRVWCPMPPPRLIPTPVVVMMTLVFSSQNS
jgi:hypothetical protein